MTSDTITKMFSSLHTTILEPSYVSEPQRSFRAEYRRRQPGYRTPSPPRHAIEPLSPAERAGNDYPFALNGLASRKRTHESMESYGTDGANDGLSQRPKSFGWGQTGSAQTVPTSINTRKASQPDSTALEFLATIATSPSLAPSGLQNLHTYQPSVGASSVDNHFSKPQPFERASKRSRSEVINSRPIISNDPRPSTSYAYPSVFWPHSSNNHAVTGYNHNNTTALYSEPLLPRSTQTIAEDDVREDAELLLSISRGFPFVDDDKWKSGNTIGQRQSYHSRGTSSEINGKFADMSSTTGLHTDMLKGRFHGDNKDSADYGNLQRSNGPIAAPYVSTVGAVIGEATSSLPVKPKDHRGWPKGKPRGPRNPATDSKRHKVKATKRGDGQQTERGASKLKGKTQEQKNLQDPVASEADPWRISFDVSPEVRRPRRISESASKRPKPESTAEELACQSRHSSAPPAISLIREGSSKMAGKKRARREQPADICKACKQNRNAETGLHELWINCNGCKSWFHIQCAGFGDERKVKEVDKYHCEECEVKHGSTTFVRKSSRAHASVDYAGLHEGKIRTAVDVPDHHYIEPIKTGALTFLPETFARLPPELVTRDYLEKCGGWNEPIMIPAALNPRPEKPLRNSTEATNDQDTADSWQSNFVEDYDYDCVPDDGQDGLDMIIPAGLTVRRAAELYGPEEKVDVIDVKLQEGEDHRWSMRQWADYYEAEGAKPVRNVISLEVSQSLLGKLIRRPKVVRDLDLQDSVWPEEETAKGVFPRVQFYCLMSVADCYTDFHIDFGGSSVYYHILKGRKTFFFIPPKAKYLKKYEEWCNSPDQNSVFLGDETKECYRVDLYPGDTMLIPSGWIHAVWTPENSLVIGGNFLTRMHYGTQIAINDIEKATNVTRKFRYPHFQKILWFTAVRYLEQDPIPSTVVDLLCAGREFEREKAIYQESPDDDDEIEDSERQPELFNTRYYSQAELEGLPDLIRYIHRTVMISLGKLPGISKSTQDAVVKSMPKDCGDHLEALRTFAMWAAWKRGNETIPPWAYPDAPLPDLDAMASEKKLSATAQKKLERQTVQDAVNASSARRTSLRSPQNVIQSATNVAASPPGVENVKTSKPMDSRRMACDACRKSKRRCTHNGAAEEARPSPMTPVSAVSSSSSSRFGVKLIKQTKPAEVESTPVMKQEPGLDTPMVNTSKVPAKKHDAPLSSPTETRQDAMLMNPYVPPILSTPKPPVSPMNQRTLPHGNASALSQKQPKARACEACRRSKHRCTHNGNGLTNGLTATGGSTKRPSTSGSTQQGPAKKIKRDSDLSTEDKGTSSVQNGVSTTTQPSRPGQDPAGGNVGQEIPMSGNVVTHTQVNGTITNPFDQMHPLRPQPATQPPLTAACVSLNGVAAPSPHYSPSASTTTPFPQTPANAPPLAEQPKLDVPDHPTTCASGGDSRSRTSSVHVQTTTTPSEAHASHSPPTSPLTELEPSSPLQRTELSPVPPPQQPRTPSTASSRKTPTTVRRRSSTVSNGVVNGIVKGSGGSRRGSGGSGKAGTPAKEKSVPVEEDESVRLAKILAAEDAGLRRRGVVRYSR